MGAIKFGTKQIKYLSFRNLCLKKMIKRNDLVQMFLVLHASTRDDTSGIFELNQSIYNDVPISCVKCFNFIGGTSFWKIGPQMRHIIWVCIPFSKKRTKSTDLPDGPTEIFYAIVFDRIGLISGADQFTYSLLVPSGVHY